MSLRDTFDQAPELYDRVRPGYPEAAFDDLLTLTGLRPGSRVLEIGCGTGQATVPLARRGLEVTAVELGSGLAEVARRNVAPYPAVVVVNAVFEDWTPPHEFDAVVAATSFHWLDPVVRLEKVRDALRPGGTLALIATRHVAGGTVEFFHDVQRCYELWMPGTAADERPPDAAEVPYMDRDELERDGRFANVAVRRYERELTYTTTEYRELLLSYSGHRALAAESREALLACIGELMDSKFDGQIAKGYLTELTVAQARAD